MDCYVWSDSGWAAVTGMCGSHGPNRPRFGSPIYVPTCKKGCSWPGVERGCSLQFHFVKPFTVLAIHSSARFHCFASALHHCFEVLDFSRAVTWLSTHLYRYPCTILHLVMKRCGFPLTDFVAVARIRLLTTISMAAKVAAKGELPYYKLPFYHIYIHMPRKC